MSGPYRNSIVTFLDILGFSNIVTSRGADEITQMLDAIEQTAAAPTGDGSDKTDILSFSDSVVRVRPAKKEESAQALLDEIKELAKAQWDLMSLGILIRGGTTIGEAATSPGRAFGPGFIRAYGLESKLAGVPRIVIDPAIITTIRAHFGSAQTITERRRLISSFKEHLKLGGDGIWFVDYIHSVRRTGMSKTQHRSSLATFRDVIIKGANSHKPNSLVLAKYLWLIRYFNSSAKRLHADKPDLVIRRTDVPIADELLLPRIR